MAYDPKGGYVLLFGGAGDFNPVYGDTWKFQAGTWTQLSPARSPPARYGADLVYDAHDGYMVLFGGETSTTATALLNDTWKWSGGTWTNISPAVSPPARFWSAMAYDARDGYVVLFGGEGSGTCPSCNFLGDTWDFISGVWINVTQPSGPSPRWLPNMSYDATDGYLIMYGGESATGFQTDTWKFVAGVWTNITSSTFPSDQSAYLSMAYDPVLGGVILFGGYPNHCSGCGVPAPSVYYTWEFSGGTWTNITPHVSPPARSEAGMAFDGTTTGYLLLFGGNTYAYFGTAQPLDDTWKLV